MATWTTILLYVIIGIALFSLASFLLSILPPKFKTAGTPADYGIEYESVRFKTKDGITLAGLLSRLPSEYSVNFN